MSAVSEFTPLHFQAVTVHWNSLRIPCSSRCLHLLYPMAPDSGASCCRHLASTSVASKGVWQVYSSQFADNRSLLRIWRKCSKTHPHPLISLKSLRLGHIWTITPTLAMFLRRVSPQHSSLQKEAVRSLRASCERSSENKTKPMHSDDISLMRSR